MHWRLFWRVLKIWLSYTLLFVVAKPLFMLMNHEAGTTAGDVLAVLWHGLPLDLSTAGYLVLLPLLLAIAHTWAPRAAKGLRIALSCYYALTALVVAVAICVDTILYGYWDLKLDASVLTYLDSLGETLKSIPLWQLAGGIVAVLAVATLMWWLLTIVSQEKKEEAMPRQSAWQKALQSLLLLVMGGIIFLFVRGGVGKSTMNVGRVYYSDRQILNHSAINPAFNFFSSLLKSHDYTKEYHFMEDAEAHRLVEAMNTDGEGEPLSLLRCSQPNIVLVIVEGFSAKFIEPLGGEAGVTPYFNALCNEGICFTQCYANSFRTDRGVVSILSGYPAFPDFSLMKLPHKSRALPSIARQLKRDGYTTTFLYGGDINFTNMNSYLLSTGYDQVVGDKHFPIETRTTHAWGVQDHIVIDTLLQQVERLWTAGKPFLATCLTLSSHEPWEVPYGRIAGNMKANSMAYADSCIGHLMEQLKASPAWDSLLVIFVADHGVSYPDGITEADPTKHHVPMLWIGGAISTPCHIDAICNQSDLYATLLGSMQQLRATPMADDGTTAPLSRNIASGSYSPYAFHTYIGGMAYIDATGATIYDIKAKHTTTDTPTPSAVRLQKAKAYLQVMMHHFNQLGINKQ